MYKNKKVSLILPTYNEKDSIAKVIREFDELNIVDEFLVINNNAVIGTSEEISKTKAIEIHEPIQGYGAAIRRGFKETSGDIIVVCEPDDTFLAKDIFKFLTYIEDVPIVYGSRTAKNFIWKGANMNLYLKWGNWFTAKLIELLFGTNCLTDVGCTYRALTIESLRKIEPYFNVNSNFFGPEMMIIGYRKKMNSVQIPINYKSRIGTSSVTGDIKKATMLGIKMIILIFVMKLRIEKKVIRFLEKI